MKPQRDFREKDPISGIRNLKIESIVHNINYHISSLVYLHTIALDVLNSCIFGSKIPIFAQILYKVPK